MTMLRHGPDGLSPKHESPLLETDLLSTRRLRLLRERKGASPFFLVRTCCIGMAHNSCVGIYHSVIKCDTETMLSNESKGCIIQRGLRCLCIARVPREGRHSSADQRTAMIKIYRSHYLRAPG